jgi:MFS family permease
MPSLTTYLRGSGQRFRTATDELTAGPRQPGAAEDPAARTNRRLLWTDGFVSNVSESFLLSFVNPFAMALGATNTQIGLLSALNNLAAAVGLIPGARIAERTHSRKAVAAFWGGTIGRVLLLMLAVLPVFFAVPAVIYLVIAFIALRSFANQMAYPAWSTLVADLVPESIRGRYFASRNIGMAIAALIFTPIAGWIIQRGGGVKGYQIGLALAAVIGFVATGIFLRIREPAPVRREATARRERLRLSAVVHEHPEFAVFTAVALLWNLALMIAGPFFSVYLVRSLGATPGQIGILAAVNSMGNIAGQRLWGGLNDRRGASWVMAVSGLLIPAIPVIWSLAPGPWWLAPVEVLSGFLWAGYGLANFNLLLGLAPAAQRERYIALYQAVVFGAAFVGPLIGSVLADSLGIRPLLWISSAGRLAASGLFVLALRRRPVREPVAPG